MMTEEQETNEFADKIKTVFTGRRDDPGFWRELWQQIRLIYYLLRDPEVPIYLKLLPFVSLAYVVFPFDFVPDLAPVLGQLDDLTIVLVFSKVFVELAPPAVVARHLDRIRAQDERRTDDDVADSIVIDGETVADGVGEEKSPEDLY